jgi:hypothetical protein
MSGDFRQTSPIIPRGTPSDELAACLKSSFLWQHIQRLQLSTNMRVQLYGDTAAGLFASKLLEMELFLWKKDSSYMKILHKMFQPKNN